MTVGAPDQLCKCPVHCVAGPAGKLREATARLQAAQYVAGLLSGDEIHMDIDGAAVAPFWNYLFEAIADAGLSVSVRTEDGTTIYTVRRQLPPARPQTKETACSGE